MQPDAPPPSTADPAARWLCLCGVAIPWVMLAFVAAASLANPGYDHMSELVSLLGTRERPHPEVMNLGFVVLGVLAHCYAWGLYRVLGRGPRARLVRLLLAICGTCVVLSGLFQDDPKSADAPATLEGALHTAFALGALFGLVLTMLVVAAAVHRNPAWAGFPGLSVAVASLVLAGSAGFLIDGLMPVHGLVQRGLYAASLIWVEAVALRAFHLARGAGEEGLASGRVGEGTRGQAPPA